MEGKRTEQVLFFRTNKKFRFRDLQFLIAKLQFEPKEFTEDDYLTLYETWEWLLEKCTSSSHRFYKYRLFLLSENKHILRYASRLIDGEQSRSPLYLGIDRMFSNYILGAHQYFGMKNSEYKEQKPSCFYKKIELVKSDQRYIGVGYKDKGSSRDKSHDGTLDWKELLAEPGNHRSAEQVLYTVDDPPLLMDKNCRISSLQIIQVQYH
jgi:hypothetical protein